MKRFISTFGIIPVLAAMWGCAVHQSEIPDPVLTVPASFSETAPFSSTLPQGRWWELFNDALLTDLVEEALVNNLDIAQAYARLKQSQATAQIISAARMPFVNLDAQAGRSSLPSAVGSTTGNNSSLSLAAGFELDLWQKLKNQSSAANLESLASQEDIQTLYLSLAARLVDIYYLAVEQRAQLALLDSIIESNKGTLTLIEARYNEGQAQALDVYQARENLAAVQARRPVAMANLAVTEHAIAVLLGRFPEKDIAGKLAVLPAVPTAYPSGLPAAMLQNRPDIRAAFLRVEARDKRLGVAVADRFPSFNLLADYGKSDSSLSSLLTGNFWDIIIKAALPVVDGGRRRAEVERNRAILEEELARYQQIVRRAFQEVDDALAKNANSEERVNLLAEQLANANESARLSLDNYMFGLEGYLPVLIAQRLQLDVETRLLSAKRQLIADRVSLVRALGGSWMDEYITRKNEELSMKN